MSKYYSVSQAASSLGITRQRVLQLIKANLIKAVKVGNHWLVLSLERKTVSKRNHVSSPTPNE